MSTRRRQGNLLYVKGKSKAYEDFLTVYLKEDGNVEAACDNGKKFQGFLEPGVSKGGSPP